MNKKFIIQSSLLLIIYFLLYLSVDYYVERNIKLLHRKTELVFAKLGANSIEEKFSKYNLKIVNISSFDNQYYDYFVLDQTFSNKKGILSKISERLAPDILNSKKLIAKEHLDLFLETNVSMENLSNKLEILKIAIIKSVENYQKNNQKLTTYINLQKILGNDSFLILKKSKDLIYATVIYPSDLIDDNIYNKNGVFFIKNFENQIIYEKGYLDFKSQAKEISETLVKENEYLGNIQMQHEKNGILFQIYPISKFRIYYIEAKKNSDIDKELNLLGKIISIFFTLAFLLSELVLALFLLRKQPSA